MENLRSLELFSGAGGLALGLARAGFAHSCLIEIDEYCRDTLIENKRRGLEHVRDWNVIRKSVSEIDFTVYTGKVALVAGGPPCQSFSMGGKARGYSDQRNLFPQAIRAVDEIRPHAFIFENVRGLLRPAFRNYVEYIRLRLEYPSFPISDNVSWEINLQRLQCHATSGAASQSEYQVVLHAVNAADYGVPQRRARVFFVGFRTDLNATWFFPKPTHSENALLIDQFVSGAYWERNKVPRKQRRIIESAALDLRIRALKSRDILEDVSKAWVTVRETLAGLPDPRSNGARTMLNHVFQPGARSYPGHTGSLLDEPAKALKAGDHGVPGGENMIRFSDGSLRYFTVRESARLQNFPDEFKFHGSWSETMRQLGNAVPVDLATIVGASVRNALTRASIPSVKNAS
jgi:DNA (cytosine-5)-methyltransferase 1